MSDFNDDELKKLATEDINPVEEYVKELKSEQEKVAAVVEEEKPEFLLPQFKTVEEQAKSYKELQALQTKQAQELAQYKKTQEMNSEKNKTAQEIAALKQQASQEEQKIKTIYFNEMENLQLALKSGKITEQEAQVCAKQLKNFVTEKLNKVGTQFQNACSKCGQLLDLASPEEYFQENIRDRNYLKPISDFLEKNYKKMPKSELENVKNLILNLENSLRDEILNEANLQETNENYRKNLNSATNLNPQANAEKIYTLAEIKKMSPDEFRKNQKAILEQFAARKIK